MASKWSKQTGHSLSEWNSSHFAQFLLQETGVAGLAGNCFGRPQNELTMRLSYVDFDGKKIFDKKNLSDLNSLRNISSESEQMDQLLHKYCGKTMEGMQVLHDYMTSL